MVKKQKKLDMRRRRECKTNYTKRMILLKGRSPRLVVRKTNRYLIIQIIDSKQAQDSVLFNVNTKELLKHGWDEKKKGSLKSLKAGYLGGLLLGKKAKELKGRIILDSGLIPNTKGSRVYAVVKGVSDAGIEIAYDKKVMPDIESIKDENFEKVKQNIGGSK
ncbi:50S ribosomal protein L18 [archaeon]|jgi:large subunit ribosomal protein L18|nr:50S ribosomal protein L18 [archaeon]MBT4242116.1 50S ribosomal protein L18 [archaeon]MBT4417804.1 50S ribosomal protein L18 [archaeon]